MARGYQILRSISSPTNSAWPRSPPTMCRSLGDGGDRVGVLDLGKMRSGGTGLLTGLPPHCTTGLPVRTLLFCRATEGVRGRWHGRVLRVPAGFLFQLHDPSGHHVICVFERRDLLAQRSVIRSQHCVLTCSSALLCGSSSAMSYCLSHIARTVVDIRAIRATSRSEQQNASLHVCRDQ